MAVGSQGDGLPMRIAYVAVSFLRSGTEQVILDLACHFIRNGHQVWTVIPELAGLNGMAEEAHGIGARVERVGPLHSEGHDAMRNGIELWRLFRRLRPDVAHFHVPWEPVCFESVAAAIAQVPVRVRTEHNPALQAFSAKQRLKMSVMDRSFSAIVYLSEGNRRSHVKNLGRRLKGSRIIGNGVDPRSITADRSDSHRSAVRRRLNLPMDAVIPVMVGTLEQRKGPLDYVRAAHVASKINPAMHFAIVGDGDLWSATEQLADELGIGDRVHLLGRRPDVRELLSSFDMYVQASYYEGMSVAMLEALAAGLPMITTRVDGVEDVLPDGTGALYVDIGDWSKLGESMTELAAKQDLRERLTAVSQRRVMSEFTVEAICQKYARLYRRLGAPL